MLTVHLPTQQQLCSLTMCKYKSPMHLSPFDSAATKESLLRYASELAVVLPVPLGRREEVERGFQAPSLVKNHSYSLAQSNESDSKEERCEGHASVE